MIIEIKIPSPGESITEVELANWMVNDGDLVEKDQEIAEIESEKATLPLIAEEAGKIKILVREGETINIGTIACTIDTDQKPEKKQKTEDKTQPAKETKQSNKNRKPEKTEGPKEPEATEKQEDLNEHALLDKPVARDKIKISPLAQKLMEEHNFSVEKVIN